MPEILNTTSNFIQNEINNDLQNGRYGEGVHTGFPPDRNGYLHVGHHKSIRLNFRLAQHVSSVRQLRQAVRFCGAAHPGWQGLCG